VASQRLVHIQEHGVDPLIFSAPYPLGWSVDIADDRLAALGDVDVLNGHLLLVDRRSSPPAAGAAVSSFGRLAENTLARVF
jgi:hypothetical protein